MLYLIQSGKYTKIGFTANLNARMHNYRSCNPSIKLLGIREGDVFLEKRYHYIFRNRFVQGEWFDIPEYIVNYLLTHQFTPTTINNPILKEFKEPIIKNTCSDTKLLEENTKKQWLIKSLYQKIIVARITNNTDSLTFTSQEEKLLIDYQCFNPHILDNLKRNTI